MKKKKNIKYSLIRGGERKREKEEKKKSKQKLSYNVGPRNPSVWKNP